MTTLASGFGALPSVRMLAQGFGAGDKDFPMQANVLRVLMGEQNAAAEATSVTILEANIDDSTPQVLGYAMERLFEAGALDVTLTPVFMKKNRPGTLISVIAAPETAEAVGKILFAETSTLGLRTYRGGTACARARNRRSRDFIRQDTSEIYRPEAVRAGVRRLPPARRRKRRAAAHGDRRSERGFQQTISMSRNTISRRLFTTSTRRRISGTPIRPSRPKPLRAFKRMQGYDVVLTTGTDEHGTKVERAAKAQGKTPGEFVDLISNEFQTIMEEARSPDRPLPTHHRAETRQTSTRCSKRARRTATSTKALTRAFMR